MQKIISVLSVFLLPTVSFARGYMMDSYNGGFSSWCSNYDLSGSMFGLFLIIPFIGGLIAIAVFIFWVMMLVDAIKHASEKTKLVWVVVIVFTHIIGALIYYFVEKRPKNKRVSGHTEHKA